MIFAFVVVLGYFVQTVAGFGSNILCVTLGVHILGDPLKVVTLVLPLSLLQTGYITLRHRKGLDLGFLGRWVLPFMGIGVGLGLALSQVAPGNTLRIAFGVLVLILAARELFALLGPKRTDAIVRALPAPVAGAFLIGAGIVHGIYASGGPLLVYVANRRGMDKHTFRSTITAVWVVMNSIMLVAYVAQGRYAETSTLGHVAMLLPAIPLGIVLGEKAHEKVDERTFKIGVFSLLAVAAVILLLKR